MLTSLLLTLCLTNSIANAFPPSLPNDVEFHQQSKAQVDEEFEDNLDLLYEIQQKVNVLAERMQKYKHNRMNKQEDNDIEKPSDCESGCDVINVDTNTVKNRTNITIVSFNIGGIVFPDDDTGSVVISENHDEDHQNRFLDRDQETESDNDVMEFPVALPENAVPEPDNDVEIFDPSQKNHWNDDSMREPQTDNGFVRNWIIGATDVNHDTGLFDSNIFTSQDGEYPEIKIFADQNGNVDERDMIFQEQKHRQRFENLFRILFE